MKSLLRTVIFASALLAPSLASADMILVLGDRILEHKAWSQVIADKDASDGCGSLGLKEFDPTTTERIMAQGCQIIMIEERPNIAADKNPKDGCGKIDLNFIMPKARDYIVQNGCATMLLGDPWDW